MRSAVPGASGPPAWRSSTSAAAARVEPVAASIVGSSIAVPGRVAMTSASASANRRRAANSTALSEDSSIHWASSITSSTGACSASDASRLSVAAPIRKRSLSTPGDRPSAPLSAAAWRGGRRVEAVEGRAQQRVEAGERELGLGLDALGLQHRHAARLLDGVPQQRGLADPGLARDHEDPARPEPGLGQQLAEAGELRSSPDQHGAILRQRLMDLVNRGAALHGAGLGVDPERRAAAVDRDRPRR